MLGAWEGPALEGGVELEGVCEGADVVVEVGPDVPVVEPCAGGWEVGVPPLPADDVGLRSAASWPFVPDEVEATSGTTTAAATARTSAATSAVSTETRPDEDRWGQGRKATPPRAFGRSLPAWGWRHQYSAESFIARFPPTHKKFTRRKRLFVVRTPNENGSSVSVPDFWSRGG